jgi:Cellulase (glycosyl hydrolase family 5)
MLRRFTLAALVVSVATAAIAVTPAAAPAAEVGINPIGQNAPQALDAMGQLGATWVRAFLRWDQVEPGGPGRWDPAALAGLEQYTSVAQLKGIKVVAVITGAPQWANGSTDPNVPPRDPQDFARFLGSLAARERGKVAAWEIWNEPDENEFWHGQVGPQQYAPLLIAAHQAIHEADPSALVLAGASTGNDYPFLEGLYAAGAGNAFDGVAVHTDTACLVTSPDQYYREADGRVGRFSFLGFREVENVLAANGNADRPIIMTELGWSATKTRCSRGASAGKKAAGVTEAQQAAYLKLAYRCLSFYPYVKAALWFNLTDTGPADSELTRYGLQRSDGSKRPAFDALAAAGHGNLGSDGCGDFTAPDLQVISPATDSVYDRSLSIEAVANDDSGQLGRISFYANDKKIRSFTGAALHDGRPVDIDWMGARALPYGPVKVTVEALDAYGNTSRREIDVRRVDPASMPAQRPVVKLKLSGKGLKRRVKGTVTAPGAAFLPGGKVVIEWQYKRKGKWVTLHKRSKNANRPFNYAQRLKKPGRWRVIARYKGAPPFKAAQSRRVSFSAR